MMKNMKISAGIGSGIIEVLKLIPEEKILQALAKKIKRNKKISYDNKAL